MPDIRASWSAVIGAPANVVYRILADYHRGHPAILPPKYFENLVVEEGGVGAGTHIRFDVRTFTGLRACRAVITEPLPGRRLVETDLDSGAVTTFTVERQGNARTRVTIETTYTRSGVGGWIERLLAPAYLRTVYRAELARLADVAAADRNQSA